MNPLGEITRSPSLKEDGIRVHDAAPVLTTRDLLKLSRRLIETVHTLDTELIEATLPKAAMLALVGSVTALADSLRGAIWNGGA